MSHFCLLVVTDEEPTKDSLAKVLQPYHEYECTGVVDEYVKEVDVTDKHRKDYEKETRLMIKPIGEEGGLRDYFGDEFYRDPTAQETAANKYMMGFGCGNGISWNSKDWGDGRGYRTKVHFVPEGYEKVEVPIKQTMTFGEYLIDWHSFEEAQAGCPYHENDRWVEFLANKQVGRVIERTNPNAKWDWWTVGGRYDGKLDGSNCKQKKDVECAVTSFALLWDGKWYERGEMGWFASVSNENDNWAEDFKKLYDTIPGDKWLTVVDCHI